MGFLPVEEADGTISKIVVREFFPSVPSRSGRRRCTLNADDPFQQAHRIVGTRGQSRSTTPCLTTSGARNYGTSQADERRWSSFVLLPFVARVGFLACMDFCQCCRPAFAPYPLSSVPFLSLSCAFTCAVPPELVAGQTNP